MPQLHNKPSLKDNRKQLRTSLTSAEATLWKALQKSRVEGRKFRRQHSVGKYILDFYCPAEKLAVELDGAFHFSHSGQTHDLERSDFLYREGIRVIRFENQYVFSDLEGILEEIKQNFLK